MTHVVGTYFNAVHHLENNSLYLTRLETYIFLLKMLTSNSRGRILKKVFNWSQGCTHGGSGASLKDVLVLCIGHLLL